LNTISTVLHPSALPKCTTNKNGLKVLTVRQSANYTYTPLALLSVGMSVVGGGAMGGVALTGNSYKVLFFAGKLLKYLHTILAIELT